jgi:hypothetical protein
MQEAAIGDPVVECSYLGQFVEDSVFAWIAFGIDVKRSEQIIAADTHH